MSDIEFGRDPAVQITESGPAAGSVLSKAANVMGAVCSIALVAGIGVWGYKLVVRDVSGLPVVRAVEGPMRAQPEDPGGRPADHQGLAVNAVAASGSAAPTADRLMLAPKPVSLSEEDVPQEAMTEAKETASSEETTDTPTVLASDQQAQVDALVAELTDGVEPLEPVTETDADEIAAVVAEVVAAEEEPAIDPADLAPKPVIVTGPGVARSPRPQIRPAVLTRAEIPEVSRASTSFAASAVEELDPDTLPAGTRLAQLGAYESADVARQEWDRFETRFADYMEGKSRVIQKASSGGRTFYRLRAAGFEDMSDARRFCSALVAEKADCIPVTTR